MIFIHHKKVQLQLQALIRFFISTWTCVHRLWLSKSCYKMYMEKDANSYLSYPFLWLRWVCKKHTNNNYQLIYEVLCTNQSEKLRWWGKMWGRPEKSFSKLIRRKSNKINTLPFCVTLFSYIVIVVVTHSHLCEVCWFTSTTSMTLRGGEIASGLMEWWRKKKTWCANCHAVTVRTKHSSHCL